MDYYFKNGVKNPKSFDEDLPKHPFYPNQNIFCDICREVIKSKADLMWHDGDPGNVWPSHKRCQEEYINRAVSRELFWNRKSKRHWYEYHNWTNSQVEKVIKREVESGHIDYLHLKKESSQEGNVRQACHRAEAQTYLDQFKITHLGQRVRIAAGHLGNLSGKVGTVTGIRRDIEESVHYTGEPSIQCEVALDDGCHTWYHQDHLEVIGEEPRGDSQSNHNLGNRYTLTEEAPICLP